MKELPFGFPAFLPFLQGLFFGSPQTIHENISYYL
jgi:hypothetical protein